jgi:hypothetical protein
MQTRTWPYGTKLKARLESKKHLENGRFAGAWVIILVDENNEAQVLLQAHGTPKNPGDKCEIEFCEGGPTGGYWKIVEA